MEQLEITLTLTVEQINFILSMLGERPLKEVIELFGRIRGQADKALAEAAVQQAQEKEP